MAEVCMDCLSESMTREETEGVDIWDVVKVTVGLSAFYILTYWFLLYTGSSGWLLYDLLVPMFAFLIVATWVIAALSWVFGGLASVLGYHRMVCAKCGATKYQKTPDASSF